MTSPTLEHAIKWLEGGYLDPLVDAEKHESPDAFDQLAVIFARVFSGREGEMVLQVLLDISLFRAPVDHRLADPEYLRWAQLRAGQNQLAATIVAYLAHAKHLKEAPNHERSGPGPGAGPAGYTRDPSAGRWIPPAAADGDSGPADWDTAVR